MALARFACCPPAIQRRSKTNGVCIVAYLADIAPHTQRVGDTQKQHLLPKQLCLGWDIPEGCGEHARSLLRFLH